MSTPHRFANKVIVVTGASTGLGFGAAQAFIQEGARVIITGQNEARLAAAAKQLGPNAIPVLADVRKVEDLERIAQRTREVSPHVDVVFANAGVGKFRPLEQTDEAFYDDQFDTNVKGLFFTVQKLVGLLKPGSSVILNSSAVHGKGLMTGSIYCATKAAVRSLARTLAAELSPRGIRVNSLSPGMVPTEFQAKMQLTDEGLENLYTSIKNSAPLRRLGGVDEIVKAVLFMASDEASYMTAADIVVDGGWMNV
ncbi:MAG TPA: SDR family oxidoreductase [Myxococcaceae bacterium]|jgi:NAD(P)-dependent dehydrogenase (short-subunit alcohol dehydrogenase family)